ncbi:MAG: hypothetical protein ABFD91_09540 [Anaerohalosphaeraceae bacterium]
MYRMFYKKTEDIIEGKLVYRQGDYSFDFIPFSTDKFDTIVGEQSTTSLLINTLQIEISIQSKRLLYIWGYCPLFNYQEADIPEIKFEDGEITLLSDAALDIGVSMNISNGLKWSLYGDKKTGWSVVTYHDKWQNSKFIRIANGCIVGLIDMQISCLCLNPDT